MSSATVKKNVVKESLAALRLKEEQERAEAVSKANAARSAQLPAPQSSQPPRSQSDRPPTLPPRTGSKAPQSQGGPSTSSAPIIVRPSDSVPVRAESMLGRLDIRYVEIGVRKGLRSTAAAHSVRTSKGLLSVVYDEDVSPANFAAYLMAHGVDANVTVGAEHTLYYTEDVYNGEVVEPKMITLASADVTPRRAESQVAQPGPEDALASVLSDGLDGAPPGFERRFDDAPVWNRDYGLESGPDDIDDNQPRAGESDAEEIEEIEFKEGGEEEGEAELADVRRERLDDERRNMSAPDEDAPSGSGIPKDDDSNFEIPDLYGPDITLKVNGSVVEGRFYYGEAPVLPDNLLTGACYTVFADGIPIRGLSVPVSVFPFTIMLTQHIAYIPISLRKNAIRIVVTIELEVPE